MLWRQDREAQRWPCIQVCIFPQVTTISTRESCSWEAERSFPQSQRAEDTKNRIRAFQSRGVLTKPLAGIAKATWEDRRQIRNKPAPQELTTQNACQSQLDRGICSHPGCLPEAKGKPLWRKIPSFRPSSYCYFVLFFSLSDRNKTTHKFRYVR